MINASQATIGGRFAPFNMLIEEDAELDSMLTEFNKAVTDTVTELLGENHHKKKLLVTDESIDCCVLWGELKKRIGELEGANDYRDKQKDQERHKNGKRDVHYEGMEVKDA